MTCTSPAEILGQNLTNGPAPLTGPGLPQRLETIQVPPAESRPVESFSARYGWPSPALPARLAGQIKFFLRFGSDRALDPARRIGALAVAAAMSEAAVSPKPGLVCPDTNGAHQDMDIDLMFASAASLEPYFAQAAALGRETAGLAEAEAFPRLRALGIRAERAMLAATGGVNTHKGLVFSLGLLSAATGRALAREERLAAAALCASAASFIQGITRADFAPLLGLRDTEGINYAKFALNIECATNLFAYDEPAAESSFQTLPEPARQSGLLTAAAERLGRRLTAGERLFLLHGVTGIRGEAEGGFPSLLKAKAVFDSLYGTHGLEAAAVNSLLHLMAETDDTNVLHRGGPQALTRLQREAALALESGGLTSVGGKCAIEKLRQTCLELYVSPGGCADLLALLFYLHFLEKSQPLV